MSEGENSHEDIAVERIFRSKIYAEYENRSRALSKITTLSKSVNISQKALFRSELGE